MGFGPGPLPGAPPCGGCGLAPRSGRRTKTTKTTRAQMLNLRFLLCVFGPSSIGSPGCTVSGDKVYAETHFRSRRMRLSVVLRFRTESLECAKP